MSRRLFKVPFRFQTKIFLVLGTMVALSIIGSLLIYQTTTKKRIGVNP